jgi:hypothetical protein
MINFFCIQVPNVASRGNLWSDRHAVFTFILRRTIDFCSAAI